MARQPRRFDREDDADFAQKNRKGQRRVRMPTWDEIVAQTSEGGSPLIPSKDDPYRPKRVAPRLQREEDTEYGRRNKRGERRVQMPSWEQIEREYRPGIPGALDETLYPSDVDDVGFDWPTRQRRRLGYTSNKRKPNSKQDVRDRNRLRTTEVPPAHENRPHPMRLFDGEAGGQLREQIKEARRTGDYSDLLDYEVTNTSNPARPRAHRAGYDPWSRQLRVMFRDGDVYTYYDVEPEIWQALKAAPSFGKALNEYVIPGKEYEWDGISRPQVRFGNVQYWDQRRWAAMQDNVVEQGSWDDIGR